MDDPPRRPLADLTSHELHQRAVEYRRLAANARGQEVAAPLERLAIRYALLAAHREVKETSRVRDIRNGERDQSELAKLIALANHTARCEPDPVHCLVRVIKHTVAGNADPYLVTGALLEGIVHTIAERIPHEQRNDTAEALLQLLKDRLRANGMAQRPA